MSRISPTLHHMHSRKYQTGIVEVPEKTFADPTFVARLSFRVGYGSQVSSSAIVDAVAGANDKQFFCDNSIFEDDADPKLWEALANHPGKFFITTEVREELTPWLAIRPNHPVSQMIATKSERLTVIDDSELTSIDQLAKDYYVALLRARRRAIAMPSIIEEAQSAKDKNGTPITPYAIAQKVFGERAAKLSMKGIGDTRGTDEKLVFAAIHRALSTGVSTIILTKDADIEEQFFKLIWLLDTHYRSMLLADAYADCFSRFPLAPVPQEVLDNGIFVGTNNVLAYRPDSMLQEVLPSNFRFVGVSCWKWGVRASAITFGAEREMYRVLYIKGKTKGLSTDKLGGRNFHAWLGPLPVPQKFRSYSAIVNDYRIEVPDGMAHVANLDVAQAMFSAEQHAVYTPMQKRSQLWTP
ncbi:hypothetical protein [Streptomyces sp. NPDC087270]|uniref:hypothetical protein n=1 Tax=Streptomyces sp. NPDC087270 TaxID=3365774 RepID=UPI0038050174